MKEFYSQSRFANGNVLLDTKVGDAFEGRLPQITRQEIACFVYGVGNNGEAFVERPRQCLCAYGLFLLWVGESYHQSNLSKGD